MKIEIRKAKALERIADSLANIEYLIENRKQ